jgi:hypothetical protein
MSYGVKDKICRKNLVANAVDDWLHRLPVKMVDRGRHVSLPFPVRKDKRCGWDPDLSLRLRL